MEEGSIRLELRDQLHDALEQMDDLDREVLSLRHFEQLTNAEVAHLLEISPNAVYIAKSRVLRRLREELSGLLE